MRWKSFHPLILVAGIVALAALTLLGSLTILASAQPLAPDGAAAWAPYPENNAHSRDETTPPGVLTATYTVNVSANPTAGGAVLKDPDKAAYAAGEVITITANANTGWKFDSWSGDLTGNTSPAFLTVSGNHSVTGNFSRRCYTLTRTRVGEGAAPTASPANSPGCDAGQYIAGQTINLTAAPATGWTVSGWSGTDNNSSTSTSNTLTMPAQNHTVSVTYSQLCYTLTTGVSPSGGGSVSAAPAPNCTGDKYTHGTTVQLTAEPTLGYVFNNWSGAVSGATSPTSVEMTANRTVTANFRLACYALSLTHTGSGSNPSATPASSSGCDASRYHKDAAISLTAVPAAGWQVDSWVGTANDASRATTNSLTMPAAAHVVTVNYIERPTLQFSAASYNVNEDAGQATIEVRRSGSLVETVTVTYATQDGTAVAGLDYEAMSGQLTFGPNVTSRTFSVTILDDEIAEGTEYLMLLLSNPSANARLGERSSAQLNILDDEGEPTVQFSSQSYSVSESAGAAPITVTLFPASVKNVFVEFRTSPGTATPGQDYYDVTRTLRFYPGDTSHVVEIPIINDTLDEPDETVNLLLSDVVNAELGQASAVLTILDDDPAPTVHFNSTDYFATEGEATAAITVTLSAASSFTVNVNYEANNVSAALPGGASSFGALTFPPGVTSVTLNLPIVDSSKGDEILLILRAPQNATLGAPSSARLFILDSNRSPCYPLTRAFTGAGGAPVVVNMSNSLGCPAGQYVADELLSLAAQPADGWAVRGWQGTLNNSSTALENIVRMPDGEHVVLVNYAKSLFLPSVSNNYISYFLGPEEVEPNNLYRDANGPLKSGITYRGRFPDPSDTDDYYFVVLLEPRRLEISLTNIGAGHNYDIILRHASLAPVSGGYIGAPGDRDEVITVNAPAGRYYIQIFNRSRTGSAQWYNLRVIYD